MSLTVRLLPIVVAYACRAGGAVCPALENDRTVQGVAASGRAACFIVNVADGEATQIAATQPVNLVIRIAGGETSLVYDGFEFGPETATLDVAGRYRVAVSPAPGGRIPPVTFDMSRKAVPLQQAIALREAESLATVSLRSGKPDDIMESLRLWQALNDPSAVARTWLKQGDAVLGAGELANARDAYGNAMKLCDSIPGPASGSGRVRCAAEAGTNSGMVFQQLGEFERSLALLTEARQAWKRLGDRKSEGKTLSNLGLLYRQTSGYEQAIRFYQDAENTFAAGDVLARAVVMNNLGVCYQFLAEYARARAYFDRALAVESRQADGARDALRARLNLGRNYLPAGETSVALRILERALLEAKALNDSGAIANVRNNLGQVLLAARQPAEARTQLERALESHRALGDQRLEASDLHFLGAAAAASGQIELARKDFSEAIRLRQSTLLREAAADSLYSLAALELTAGDRATAHKFAEQALLLLESVRLQVPGATLRASFYSQKRRFFDLLLETIMAADNQRAAEDGLMAAERGRGRALLDLLAEGSGADLIPSELIPKELLEQRRNLQRRIDLISARISLAKDDGAKDGQESALREQAQLLIAEDERIETEFHRKLASRRVGQPLESVEKLRHEFLPPDCALLEFHLGEHESYLWLVKPDAIQVYRLPPRRLIEMQAGRAIRLFREVRERQKSPIQQAAFERAMRLLSRTLLGQLPRDLPARLIIVPDGALYRVPFAALRLQVTGRSLGLDYDLLQIPAAAYLGAGRKPRKVSSFPEAMVAVADPVFSSRDRRVAQTPGGPGPRPPERSLARLPFDAELKAVAPLIHPASRLRILRDFEATPARLRQLRLQDYAILHFSTHALIDDQIPELSKIALSQVDRSGRPVTDGFLRPYQLSEFHFDGSTVVLSACDTALGKEVLGEGMAGFTASLLHAGAAQIVLTLAEVDAEGSSEFLKETYPALFSPADISMEHALTLARRKLGKSKRWSDPYYWASFVVYGRPADGR